MFGLGTAMLVSGLASAIAGLGTGVGSAVSQYNAQKEANATNLELTRMANDSQMQQVQATNAFNAAEAQKAREWNEYMSNTQVQRAVADYEAAGLNPLLAVPGGASYQTPASATGEVASIKSGKVNPVAFDLSGVSSALQSMSNLMLISSLIGNRGLKLNNSNPAFRMMKNAL